MKDLIIVGVGPAGLAGSIYASRYNLEVLVIGKESGGCMNESYKIENYPGFEAIPGFELGQKMKAHAKKLGAEIKEETVVNIEKIKKGYKVVTSSEEYKAKRILLATGTIFRRLEIPGEDKFSGRGVSYCATCDGPFFKKKRVIVVGGGNSALNAALSLSKYADEVVVFFRAEDPTAIPRYQERVKETKNIKLVGKTNLVEIKGEQKLSSVVLDNPWKGEKEHQFDGVFIEIGSRPDNELFKNLKIELDERGYIKVGKDQSTNVEGIFAAGDITNGSNGFRQIVTACSEGSIAVAAVNDLVQKEGLGGNFNEDH